VFTHKFVKDFGLMKRRHKNIDKILEVMSMIIWEEPLPAKNREHTLSGNYSGYAECHIEGDLLLIRCEGSIPRPLWGGIGGMDPESNTL
jgi:mRNA interferase YafQ